MQRLASLTVLAALGLATLPVPIAPAVEGAITASDDEPWVRKAKIANLRALSKRITLDVTDQPVEDIFRFISDVTSADIEPIYLDDSRFDGIDPETTITIRANNIPALTVLERVLARTEAAEQPASGYTWQFTDTGSIEIGPKSELNSQQIVELYDIAELLFVVPRFENAPQFDLGSALQSGQGGGGSSPFQGGQNDDDDVEFEDRVQRLVDLIQANIEPDEWTALGGNGASLTTFSTSLVITAPDYIHRQINGYDFWPSRLQQTRRVNGRTELRILPDTRRKP
ncbi:MAG: hypothetical protein AB8F26_09010 [Phycisphaerales bacterium]